MQVRRLAMALARTFWDPRSPELHTLAAVLEDEARWQVGGLQNMQSI